jgi:hypothetical protein
LTLWLKPIGGFKPPTKINSYLTNYNFIETDIIKFSEKLNGGTIDLK